MKRIITMALLGLSLTGGVALADRHGGHNDRRPDRREVRQDRREIRQDRRELRHDRREFRADNRRVQRSRPVFRGGSWYFDGGVRHTYRAPVVRYRYRNYYQRPVVLVENYDTVPGYYWVAGNWTWNGGEWIWTNGHYEIDANYGY